MNETPKMPLQKIIGSKWSINGQRTILKLASTGQFSHSHCKSPSLNKYKMYEEPCLKQRRHQTYLNHRRLSPHTTVSNASTKYLTSRLTTFQINNVNFFKISICNLINLFHFNNAFCCSLIFLNNSFTVYKSRDYFINKNVFKIRLGIYC